MIRRILAALVALILAGVGAFLVVAYASNADDRAMADMDTVNVLVATGPIPEGTPGDQLKELDLVELQPVPAKFVLEDAVDNLGDLEGEMTTTTLVAGEQLTNARFATAESLRARGDYPLPDEAKALHQLTINLPNPQALGGSIAPGDTVGLFATYELEPPTGWTVAPDGELIWNAETARSNDAGTDEGDEQGSGDSGTTDSSDTITFTDLVLDKVLVVRVEGGYVASTSDSDDEDGEAEAQDTIHVTVALEPQEAARVIQSMQTGTVWLTLSPEVADEADIDAVVPAAPTRVTGVVE